MNNPSKGLGESAAPYVAETPAAAYDGGETLGRRIRAARDKLDWSQDRLAAELHVAQVTVSRWEADKSDPHDNYLRRIADLTGTTVAALRYGAASADDAAATAPAVPPPADTPAPSDAVPVSDLEIRPGHELVGARDLPIYGTAEGGPTGMTITYEPIEWVRRPGPLMGVNGGFGFYVLGESMEPVYRPGDMVLVHPTRPVFRGDEVLVVLRDGKDGTLNAMVKIFEGWAGEKLRLSQYNPREKLKTIDRAMVHGVHLIVGNYRGRR